MAHLMQGAKRNYLLDVGGFGHLDVSVQKVFLRSVIKKEVNLVMEKSLI